MADETVLIVDDDTRTVELLKLALEMGGMKMLHTQSGQDGIQIARESMPNLILMDLMLPSPSIPGWEAIRILKNDPELQHIPIIVVSAAGGENIMKSMREGADDFMEKPFSITEFRRKVARTLELTKP